MRSLMSATMVLLLLAVGCGKGTPGPAAVQTAAPTAAAATYAQLTAALEAGKPVMVELGAPW